MSNFPLLWSGFFYARIVLKTRINANYAKYNVVNLGIKRHLRRLMQLYAISQIWRIYEGRER